MRRPLLMFRTPNAYGPFWQPFGGKLVHTPGNYFGAGGTTAPAPNIGFTIWDDGETFWDVDTRTNEPATTWDRRR